MSLDRRLPLVRGLHLGPTALLAPLSLALLAATPTGQRTFAGAAGGVQGFEPSEGDGKLRPLFPEEQFFVPTSERAIATADLDGDGDLDLAVGSLGAGTVSVLRNDGSGTFAPPEEYATGSALWLTAGDLDGDGDVDLAAAGSGAPSTIIVLLNEGDGTFAAPVDYEAADFSSVVLDADVDGDGDRDLVAGSTTPFDDQVTVLRNLGDGSFGPPEVLVVGSYRSFGLLDVERDGDVDLVVLSDFDGALVLRNDGTGAFTPDVTYASGNRPVSVATEDLNGDGHADLAVANIDPTSPTSASISVLLNTGGGTFEPRVAYGALEDAEEIATADLNGDERPDLVVSTGGTDFYVFTNLGDGTFAPEVRYEPGLASYSLASGDLDGDRDVDLVVGTHDDRVKVILNDKNRRLETHTRLPADSPFGVSLVFLDADKLPDLVYASYDLRRVAVRLNDGRGGFAPPVTYATGPMPRAVGTGDLDGDGDQDLGVVTAGNNRVAILRNEGDGTFAPQQRYTVGADPLEIAVGDLDGDGAPDLAVTRFAFVSVLLNDGAAAFAPPTSYDAGFSPRDVASGDLDGDGYLDLVVTNHPAGSVQAIVSVLLNEGAGTFAPRVRHGTGGSESVVLADLDTDGILDVAVGERFRNVAVLRNLGDAKLAPQVSYPTASAPFDLVARDLDGDGDLDLAAATSFFGSTVTVLPGHGDGTFGPSRYHGTASAVIGLACGDVDGDRDLELVTCSQTFSNPSLSAISILWNRLRSKPRIIDGVQAFSVDEVDRSALSPRAR